jgi:hypothetical protein
VSIGGALLDVNGVLNGRWTQLCLFLDRAVYFIPF